MNVEALLSDADIRPKLMSRVLAPYSGDQDTVLLEELGIRRGQVRVDLAVVNGIIHGYEIKSDLDSLRRLKQQVELYGKVLDRATLVSSERHLQKAMKLVQPWWGVQQVEARGGELCFSTVRRNQENPSRDARTLVEFLWLDDAVALLEKHGVARGVRGKPRRCVWDRICETLDIDVIAAAVRANLKARPRHPTRL